MKNSSTTKLKGEVVSESGYSGSNVLQALRLTKISLLIFLLGICVVVKRKSTWPIVSWALYSEYSVRFRPPEPSVSAVELRVYTTAGDLYVVKPEQILTLPRDSLAHKVVEQAFASPGIKQDTGLRDASRSYLTRAIANLIHKSPAEIETIQAWKSSYKVEPLAVPPIQMQAPDAEVLLGSFSAKSIAVSD